MQAADQTALLFFVGTPDPSQLDARMEYTQRARALLAGAGAQPMGKFRTTEHLIGNRETGFVSVAIFPSADSAHRFFHESPAYRDIVPLRDRALPELNVLLAAPGQTFEGLPDDKAVLVVVAKPNRENPDAMMRYLRKAGEIAHKYGGENAARFAIRDTIVGDREAQLVGFSTFPNEEAARNFFADPEYAEITKDRDEGFAAVDAYLLA